MTYVCTSQTDINVFLGIWGLMPGNTWNPEIKIICFWLRTIPPETVSVLSPSFWGNIPMHPITLIRSINLIWLGSMCVHTCMCACTRVLHSFLFYGETESCHVLHLHWTAKARGREEKWSQALESLFPLSFLIIQAKRQPSLSKLVQIWSVTYNQNNSDLCNKHGHLPKGSFFTIKFVQFPNIFISWSLYVFE